MLLKNSNSTLQPFALYIYIYILKRLSLTFYLQNIITGNAAKIWNDLPIYGLTILATPYNSNQDNSNQDV